MAVPAKSAGNAEGTLLMEDARIMFRNFSGREGQYNREGDRNFVVFLEEDLAAALFEDGWNVKRLKPQGDEPLGQAYLQVSVGYKGRPPVIALISSAGRVNLGQHECEVLDWIEIAKADLIIRPYNWNVNGKTGIKAYLKSLFVTMNEDFLQLKYAEVPMANNELASPAEMKELESAGQDASDIVDAELVED